VSIIYTRVCTASTKVYKAYRIVSGICPYIIRLIAKHLAVYDIKVLVSLYIIIYINIHIIYIYIPTCFVEARAECAAKIYYSREYIICIYIYYIIVNEHIINK